MGKPLSGFLFTILQTQFRIEEDDEREEVVQQWYLMCGKA
jgi:hypothetical protein